MPPPTYRLIAEAAGVSIFSVSCALCNRPGISAKKRAHICQIAEQMGYKPNPLVTALMTQRRSSAPHQHLRAIIACLMSRETHALLPRRPQVKDRLDGARAACEQAGFIFNCFYWDDYADKPSRLFAALNLRNVPGVVFLGGEVPDWGAAGWERYAMASAGNRRLNLRCHFTCADDYLNTWTALTHLEQAGYRRIGFTAIRSERLIRSDYRSLAAWQAWHTVALPSRKSPPPPLLKKEWNPQRFQRWFDKHKPDVIISPSLESLSYLREQNTHIPQQVGFVHLNITSENEVVTGIRQNNYEMGQAAANLVIDQINRNTYGYPDLPLSIQIVGDWRTGETLLLPTRTGCT